MADPIVTVELDGREVLRLVGPKARVLVTPLDDQRRVAAALGQALGAFLASQPPVAPLAVAADALAKQASACDPAVYRADLIAIADAITDLSDRLGAEPTPTH